jgi:tRNA pseudouridine38-40 synthase
MLPNSIVVHAIEEVEATKHARFDAKNRTYRYFMHSEKNPFIENSWYFPKELNLEAMNKAAEALLGTQDFTSLSKLHTDVKTNICTVYKAHWCIENNQLIFEIEADRFLRNMVRATVGTLIEVGSGKLEPKDIPIILAAKDRQAAKTSVPAHGLFLWDVVY